MKQNGPMWLKTETKAMLNIIKDNNLLKFSLSDSELIQILVKLMKERGYDRTPLQIRMKLKALEKNYFSCKKKGFDTAVLKQFTHFNILNELYSRKRRKDNEESDGGMISDFNDDNPNIWLAEEIQKMMSIIEEGNLAPDLSNGFTLFALKIISEELSKSGYDKDVEQVETALTSLKMTYKKTQEALKSHVNIEICPYFDCLQKLWGSECELENRNNNNDNNNQNAKDLLDKNKVDECTTSANTFKSQNVIVQKANGHFNDLITSAVIEENSDITNSKWPEEETLAFLTAIGETYENDEFIYDLSISTTNKLREAFTKRGYNRSIEDVTEKLKYLRDNYVKSILNGSKSNENCQYNTKIDNMIVVKKVDVDKALKTLDGQYKTDHKLRADHNYVNIEKIKFKEEPIWLPMESVTENEDDFETYASDVKIIDEIIKGQSSLKIKNLKDNISKKCENSPSIQQKLIPIISSTPMNSSKSVNKSETDQKEKTKLQSDTYNDQSNEFLKMMTAPLPTKLIKIINRDPAIIVERISSSQPPGLVFIPPVSSSGSQNLTNINCQPQNTIASPTSSPQQTTASSQTIPIMKSKLNTIPIIQNLPKMSAPLPDLSKKSLPITSVVPLNSDVPKSTLELIFKHEELMQQQHQKWMERQFEIQRKYDRDQRVILLNELRELKKVFTQAIVKSDFLSNSNS